MTTWNPADKTSSLTLSNGNLTATTEDNEQFVRATAPLTGKKHIEITMSAALNDQFLVACGLYDGASSLVNFGVEGTLILLNDGTLHEAGVGSAVEASFGTTNGPVTVVIEADVDADLAWFALGAGNWNASGTANPATGTEGISIAALATVYPYWGAAFGQEGTINFGATTFTRTPSAGFTGPDSPVAGGLLMPNQTRRFVSHLVR